jgi:anti-sigma regulatory factor (Ser/Thr protein kinase)
MRHRRSAPSVPQQSEGTTPRLTLQRDVPAGVDAIQAVRTDLRPLLREWQLDERLANAVLDVAQELLVNAHHHATPPVQLTVTTTTDEVRVEVRDASSDPARLLPYRPGLSDHGLGLQLVRQLSRRWGQRTLDDGKVVWAVFSRRPGRTG